MIKTMTFWMLLVVQLLVWSRMTFGLRNLNDILIQQAYPSNKESFKTIYENKLHKFYEVSATNDNEDDESLLPAIQEHDSSYYDSRGDYDPEEGRDVKRGRWQGFCFRRTRTGRRLPYICWRDSDR